MTPWVQYGMLVLGLVGAAATWFRAWIAWKTYTSSLPVSVPFRRKCEECAGSGYFLPGQRDCPKCFGSGAY